MFPKCFVSAIFTSILARILCESANGFFNNSGKKSYTKEVFLDLEGQGTPWDMDISDKTGNMYIVTSSKLFMLKKGETEVQQISTNQQNAYSVAVNSSTGKVFVAYSNGLKSFDEISGVIEDVPDNKHWCIKLFIEKNSSKLYAQNWPNSNLIKFENPASEGENSKILLDRRSFAVDFEGNYFFTNKEDTQYVTNIILKGSSVPRKYGGDISMVMFAVDNKGKVYGVANNGDFRLYHLKTDEEIPKFVTNLDFLPTCMCFDKNNNLYFGTDSISIQIVVIKLSIEHSSTEL